MRSFSEFSLEEAYLRESLIDRAKGLADKLINKSKKLLSGLEFERKETMFMLKTFFTQLKEILKKEKSITDEDVKRAVKQLGDLGKFSLIAPLFLLPGGGTTTTVLYFAGKKLFNISILPQGLEQVFEVIEDIEETKNMITEVERNTMKEFEEYLQESSLSRIWRMTQEHESGAISGFRDENTRAQNKSNNRDIVAYLKSKGYSVTSVKGSYIENFGSDNAKEVGEPSFFVVDINDTGNLEKDLVKLGKRFDQDSVLIVPKGGKGAYLRGTSRRDDAFPSYGQKEVVGNSRFGKVAGQFLSRVRGRQFAFEHEEVTLPQTINGKRGWQILADKIDEETKEED